MESSYSAYSYALRNCTDFWPCAMYFFYSKTYVLRVGMLCHVRIEWKPFKYYIWTYVSDRTHFLAKFSIYIYYSIHAKTTHIRAWMSECIAQTVLKSESWSPSPLSRSFSGYRCPSMSTYMYAALNNSQICEIAHTLNGYIQMPSQKKKKCYSTNR